MPYIYIVYSTHTERVYSIFPYASAILDLTSSISSTVLTVHDITGSFLLFLDKTIIESLRGCMSKNLECSQSVLKLLLDFFYGSFDQSVHSIKH
jgi:hypothetical protein